MSATGQFIALASATLRRDRSVTRPADKSGQVCHPTAWDAILGLLRRRHPTKTAYLIAARTGHSLRTVRRWMSGRTVPGIDVGFDLIAQTGDGPVIIEIIARSLPPKERAEFFRELALVAKRAELRARLDALDD